MDKPVAYGSFYVAYQCGFFTNQCFYTMICKLSEKLHLEKKVRYQKCTRIIRRWCKCVEIRKIMGGLVHNVRDNPVHLDKVQFAPKAPICSKSSRLHQKFSPTQMHPTKCTESFSERSKSSHLHQKFPIVLTLFFIFFC